MLSTMRQAWLLYALFALIGLSSALNIDGIEAYLHHGVVKRQDTTGAPPRPSSDDNTPVSTPDPDTTTDGDDNTPTSTPPPSTPPNTPSTNPAPSQTPPPSSNPPPNNDPTSRDPDNTPATTGGEDNNDPAPTSSAVVRTSSLFGTSITSYSTVWTTIVDGQTLVSSGLVGSTSVYVTGSTTSTDPPLPQEGDGNSGGGGLSDSNKKIIGGVVGGVGGAILLGGLAIVWWRLRNKKQRVAEDDDDLMAGTGAALGDKSHAHNGTPFQSNLEQYHNPGGRPNAASNF